MTSTAMTQPDMPEATWTKDSGQWRVAVPPHLARPGERVTVARADGSRLRAVTIKEVTTRSFAGKAICTIETIGG